MKTLLTKLQDGDNKTQMTLFVILITVAVVGFILFKVFGA